MNYCKKVIFGLCLFLGISCGKNEKDDSALPEWNKDHTATIQFYSRLGSQSLFSDTDYSQVVSRIQTVSNQAVLLDRADALYTESGIVNPTVTIAAETTRVPLFNPGNFNGSMIEGTGVLIKHTYTEAKNEIVAPGVSMLSIATRLNSSIPLFLSTISVTGKSQIETGLPVITKNIDANGVVVIGIIDKSLKEDLKSRISAKSYRLSTVESSLAGSEKAIFVLSSQKWVLRESAETVFDNGILGIDLKIEAL